MVVPLVLRLQEHFPQAKIYWIIDEKMVPLVAGLPNVEFIKIKKPRNLADYRRFYQHIKSYSFDVLLVVQASLRTNLLCPFIPAKLKYGYGRLHSRDLQRLFVNRVVVAQREHLVDSFLRFAEALGARRQPPVWHLPLPTAATRWAKQQLGDGRFVAVCPTASKAERDWPIDRYLATLQTLQHRWQFTPILLGGNEPRAIAVAATLAAQLHPNCRNLTGQSTLPQLAALLAGCDALLAGDTGPVHIANAVKTPVVGLYAVAPPEKTGPYEAQHRLVNRFPQAVRLLLKKEPSQISWRQRVHSQAAMRLIEVDAVVAQCDALFASMAWPRAKTDG